MAPQGVYERLVLLEQPCVMDAQGLPMRAYTRDMCEVGRTLATDALQMRTMVADRLLSSAWYCRTLAALRDMNLRI